MSNPLPTLPDLEQLKQAIREDNAPLARRLLEQHPALQAGINDPVAAFDSPLITTVRSPAMLDVLCAAGADINARSRWWAGGFGLLDHASPELAAYAIQHGAILDAHAASRLGLLPKLRELIAADPSLVHARGGDGQTPLHFASTVAVAEFLLAQGADINALDVDHESTPAQYMIRDRQEVCRYLVQRGCQTDLFLAAAVGDADLVRRHLAANPAAVGARVNDEYFPRQNPRSGGIIYHWTLGWHVSAHDVARQFGQHDIFRLLMEHSPADVKLLVACWAGDAATVHFLLAVQPDQRVEITEATARHLVYAARNNQTAAVRLLLGAGWPVDVRGPDGTTPLHWAAFHGNAEMARELLPGHPPLEATDTQHHGTPLGWAIYGSEYGWHCRSGDYPATVQALLQAGAKPPDKLAGTEAVQTIIHSVTATG